MLQWNLVILFCCWIATFVLGFEHTSEQTFSDLCLYFVYVWEKKSVWKCIADCSLSLFFLHLLTCFWASCRIVVKLMAIFVFISSCELKILSTAYAQHIFQFVFSCFTLYLLLWYFYALFKILINLFSAPPRGMLPPQPTMNQQNVLLRNQMPPALPPQLQNQFQQVGLEIKHAVFIFSCLLCLYGLGFIAKLKLQGSHAGFSCGQSLNN